MPHPLEHSYNWRTATVFASLAALICVGVLARSNVPGRLWALVVVVVLWALIVGVITCEPGPICSSTGRG